MTTNHMVSLRPFVILAIRMTGPGRRRVGMVKLVHDMNDARQLNGRLQVAADRQPQAIPSEQRVA